MAPRTDSPGMGLGLSLMASESDRFEIRAAEGGGTEVLLRFGLGARAASRCRFLRDDSAARGCYGVASRSRRQRSVPRSSTRPACETYA